MKKRFMLIGLIVLLFLSGCIEEADQKSSVKDCGQDMNCFMDYFSRCEPAKVRQGGEFISYYEIKGRDKENNCEVSVEQ